LFKEKSAKPSKGNALAPHLWNPSDAISQQTAVVWRWVSCQWSIYTAVMSIKEKAM